MHGLPPPPSVKSSPDARAEWRSTPIEAAGRFGRLFREINVGGLARRHGDSPFPRHFAATLHPRRANLIIGFCMRRKNEPFTPLYISIWRAKCSAKCFQERQLLI